MPTRSKVKKPTRNKTAKRVVRAGARKPASIAPAKPARAKKPKRPAVPPARIPHRAIFVDVENTSSEVDLLRVLDALKIDRAAQPTELTAAGNWKSVGQRLARRLAELGAQLAHSAPAIGVRDWSDLWIAVEAGCWLGQADPGDQLDIVSDDRAFDAVGDAAAARGVRFQRVSYRTQPVAQSAVSEPSARRSHRGGHRRRGSSHASGERTPRSHSAQTPRAVSVRPEPASTSLPVHEEAHAASPDQIAETIARLTGGSAERWVNLDVLANALKAGGFTRPPGSPRLVTRLRKLKDLEVSPNGMVRLVRGLTPEATSAIPNDEVVPGPRRRPRRRGGRGRRRPEVLPATQEEPSAPADAEPDGNRV